LSSIGFQVGKRRGRLGLKRFKTYLPARTDVGTGAFVRLDWGAGAEVASLVAWTATDCAPMNTSDAQPAKSAKRWGVGDAPPGDGETVALAEGAIVVLADGGTVASTGSRMQEPPR
jgi:hypothetical protein